jgi:hypothetical protein
MEQVLPGFKFNIPDLINSKLLKKYIIVHLLGRHAWKTMEFKI